ncbi:group I intron-associated PD-(D/E)XK endonuclease [Halobaculum sp. EA56]|uniref:group I intron-associated PD-(D/E)XK endonuclease n=1 Tax=Halobaculum sp. EA56 TaxID=3421648 RepID=UPI003EBA6FF1
MVPTDGLTNSKDTGDVTEARSILELTSAGYSVSVPFGDNDSYDLLVEVDDGFIRVQCKTAWSVGSRVIRFNTHSQTTADGEYYERTYDGEVDAFFVRYPETDTCYWVDIDAVSGHRMDLREEAEIDHPAINWAEDYEFDGTIPQ